MNQILQWIQKLTQDNQVQIVMKLVSVAGMVLLSVLGLFKRIHSQEKWVFRKKIEEEARECIRTYRSEEMFFQEDLGKKRIFFRKMTIQENGKPIRKWCGVPLCLTQKSWLLIGEAGCGKSEILKNDFEMLTAWCRLPLASSGCYFFDMEQLLKMKDKTRRERFLNRLKNAAYKRFFLYVDGIDELEDGDQKFFREFLEEVRENTEKVIFRFACRTEYVNKHLQKIRFDRRFQVNSWEQTQLQQLAELILKSLKRNNPSLNIRGAETYIKSADVPWEFINSPLLLKMLLYIRIFSLQNWEPSGNRFSFYTSFFQTLAGVYNGRHCIEIYDIDKEIDQAAERIFQAYQKHEKVIRPLESLRPLLKRPPEPGARKVGLVHQTFCEYLTARYYHNQFINAKVGPKAVEVLRQNYSNDYADFITAAFQADSKEQQAHAMRMMGEIYAYTLLPGIQSEFQKTFSFAGTASKTLSDRIRKAEKEAGEKENPFLNLKYEIVFRFGRFDQGVEREFRIRVLQFIYNKDQNTKATVDADYFTAVLKRCCAISSSFLGGEEIELDYVKHMLDFPPYPYDANYDLANRSHTLIYYFDVPDSNIYTFRDSQGENSWAFARAKRINRLAFPLPDSVGQMSPGERRKYYFRVFDLATVYTFLRSRPADRLSEAEKEIIRNTKICFTDMSPERAKLLQSLKQAAVQWIDQSDET